MAQLAARGLGRELVRNRVPYSGQSRKARRTSQQQPRFGTRSEPGPDLSSRPRNYGDGGEEFGTIVVVGKPMEMPRAQVDDLSRSLVTFEQNSTLVVALEMSQSSLGGALHPRSSLVKNRIHRPPRMSNPARCISNVSTATITIEPAMSKVAIAEMVGSTRSKS